MGDMDDIKARFRDVSSVPETLAVSFSAFEVIRVLARGNEDRVPELFAAFMMAADAAVDGREAVMAAPSLPVAGEITMPGRLMAGADVSEIADAMAAVGALLGEHLARAAAIAAPGDRAACEQAAEAAGRVCALMARGDGDAPLR